MIVTKSALRADASITRIRVNLNFDAIKAKRRESHYLTNEIWVFLSHKHGENETLVDVISILQQHGSNVYVDWMDETMPSTTCLETAHKLKDKITSCKKFIFVATEAAINSKWCNWEVGIGDVKKYLDHIAIFPIAESLNSYTGKEYLQIYPTIEKVESGNYPDNSSYHIKFPNSNRIDSLKSWLLKK